MRSLEGVQARPTNTGTLHAPCLPCAHQQPELKCSSLALMLVPDSQGVCIRKLADA